MPRTRSKKHKQPSVSRRRPLAMVEARRRLSALPEQLAGRPGIGALKITRRGKPVLAVMSWEEYESLTETLEILSDPEMMAAFHQGVRDIEAGRTIPLEQLKRELDFDVSRRNHRAR